MRIFFFILWLINLVAMEVCRRGGSSIEDWVYFGFICIMFLILALDAGKK